MNNNAPVILRTLIAYAVCVPLALVVGYLLTNTDTRSSQGFLGIFGLLLISPLLMRWHYPLLVFSWGASIAFGFVPGAPNLWLCMVVLSLGLSVLERILSRQMHFIRVPSITWPLLAIFAVVVITAELTGGIGLRVLGSAVYGGKKYVILFISIFSYFALTSRPIPLKKAYLYVGLFFLGRATAAIGDFSAFTPSWLHLSLFFPQTLNSTDTIELGVTRLGGIGNAAMGSYFWLMSRYGIRGIFLSGSLWRLFRFAVFAVCIVGDGYRSVLFLFVASFLLMFFMEGLHRTQLLMVFGLAGVLACVAVIPLASKLPYTFQRALAFLPLKLDEEAVQSADASTNWRLNMWTALLPQVPRYLLLGKGFAISTEDYNEAMTGGSMAAAAANLDAAQNGLALSSDFHNGMLSVILPFGIWGVLATFWFFWAGLKVLYRNWKYGDPSLRLVNAILFILFFIEAAEFASCFAGLSLASELQFFIGYLGLSIALNNGVCAPAAKAVHVKKEYQPPRIYPHLRPAPFPR
jgi:hypothetical protein